MTYPELSLSLSLLGGLNRKTELENEQCKDELVNLASEGLFYLSKVKPHLVFVDVGSQTRIGPGAEISIFKTGIVETTEIGEIKVENMSYDIVVNDIPISYFYFIISGGDRSRQGLSYLIELATLYDLAKKHTENSSNVIAIKHGPLLQQIAHLFHKVYNIDRDVLEATLRFSGLDNAEASDISRDSRVKNSNKSNIGLAVLGILERMYNLTNRSNVIFAGVVENVHRSRILLRYATALLVTDALTSFFMNNKDRIIEPDDLKIAVKEEFQQAITDLYHLDNNLIETRTFLNNCFCENIGKDDLIDGVRELAGKIFEDLSRPFNRNDSKIIKLCKEIADKNQETKCFKEVLHLITSTRPFDNERIMLNDPDLILLARYLGILQTPCTKPIPRLDVLPEAENSLKIRSKELFNGKINEPKASKFIKIINNLTSSTYFSYIDLNYPIRCYDLLNDLREAKISIRPCDLIWASNYQVAPPIRLEILIREKEDRFHLNKISSHMGKMLLGFSISTRYKFPVHIMIADKASRINSSEIGVITPLTQRLTPLRYFIRSWEKRLD